MTHLPHIDRAHRRQAVAFAATLAFAVRTTEYAMLSVFPGRP